MKKSTSKFLAFFLALTMVISMLPVTALAAEGDDASENVSVTLHVGETYAVTGSDFSYTDNGVISVSSDIALKDHASNTDSSLDSFSTTVSDSAVLSNAEFTLTATDTANAYYVQSKYNSLYLTNVESANTFFSSNAANAMLFTSVTNSDGTVSYRICKANTSSRYIIFYATNMDFNSNTDYSASTSTVIYELVLLQKNSTTSNADVLPGYTRASSITDGGTYLIAYIWNGSVIVLYPTNGTANQTKLVAPDTTVASITALAEGTATVTADGVTYEITVDAYLKAGSDQVLPGTTTAQPFNSGTGGSTYYRIPALITLSNGYLVGAVDARYDTTGDGGGLDTILSVSKDNGDTWTYSYPIYFPDSDGYAGTSATTVIDPVLIQGSDGTVYLMADVNPTGVTTMGGYTYPGAGTGYINVNGEERLALTSVYANAATAPSDSDTATYEYYVGDFTDGYAPVIVRATGLASDYVVDECYNIYEKNANGDLVGLTQTQVNSSTTIQQNAFYAGSVLHVYNTGYMWLAYSKDNCETWNHTILNPQIKRDDETALLVSPGRGTLLSDGTIIFTFYTWDYSSSSTIQQSSFIYSKDNGQTWTRVGDIPIGNGWSSENELVELADGTLRMFVRNGNGAIYYADATWTGSTYEWESGIVSTGVTATSTCNVSAIMYSKQIDGKDAILVACPSYGGTTRSLGKIHVFLVNEDNSMEHAYEYTVTNDSYAYSCLTELNDGSIGLLWEANSNAATIVYDNYDIATIADGAVISNNHLYISADASTSGIEGISASTATVEGIAGCVAYTVSNNPGDLIVTIADTPEGNLLGFYMDEDGNVVQVVGELSDSGYTFAVPDGVTTVGVMATDSAITEIVDVTLAIGGTATYTGVGNQIQEECDSAIAGAAATYNTDYMAAVGSDANFSGGTVPLSNALYTFTASGSNWVISNGDVYLNLGTAGYPNTDKSETIQIAASTNGTYYLYDTTDGRYLWFHRTGTNCFDQNSTLTAESNALLLYRPVEDGETSSAEIPGYVQVTYAETLTSGSQYLIVAVYNSEYYVLYPSTSTTSKYAHVAKVAGEQTAYSLTLTGVAEGTTTLVIGSTQYNITVTDEEVDTELKVVDVTLSVGSSVSYPVSGTTTDETNYNSTIASMEIKDVQAGAWAALGSDSSFSGDKVALSNALYTFTGSSNNGWTIQNGEVYMSLATAGIPNSTTASTITVGQNTDGTFYFSYSISSNYTGYLFFWRDGKNRFDRNSSLSAPATSFLLYRPAEDGETSSTAIPGYVQVTSLDDITSGSQYLIVAAYNEEYYVLYPSTSTSNKYSHVGKVSVTTESSTTVTFTGETVGTTSVVVGDTQYNITVETVKENAGNYTVTYSFTATAYNGTIYYSIDGGELVEAQAVTNANGSVTYTISESVEKVAYSSIVWFAAPDEGCAVTAIGGTADDLDMQFYGINKSDYSITYSSDHIGNKLENFLTEAGETAMLKAAVALGCDAVFWNSRGSETVTLTENMSATGSYYVYCDKLPTVEKVITSIVRENEVLSYEEGMVGYVGDVIHYTITVQKYEETGATNADADTIIYSDATLVDTMNGDRYVDEATNGVWSIAMDGDDENTLNSGSAAKTFTYKLTYTITEDDEGQQLVNTATLTYSYSSAYSTGTYSADAVAAADLVVPNPDMGEAIVDFGLPVTWTSNDEAMQQKDLTGRYECDYGYVTVTSTLADGKYTHSFTYTPEQILQGVEHVVISYIVNNKEYLASMRIYPATTVYYEEGFATYGTGWTVAEGGSWTGTDNKGTGTQAFEKAGLHTYNYGYDPAYASTTTTTGATTATAGNSLKFTFTGTGVDLFANCSTASGVVGVRVTNSAGTVVKLQTINTKNTGAYALVDNAYNTPITSLSGLTLGTYTVTLYVASGTFCFDGFRVYNTTTSKSVGVYIHYENDLEENPAFYELRNAVLAGLNVDVSAYASDTASQIYASADLTDSVLVLDTTNTYSADNLQSLLENGPKNELYLQPGQSVAFKLNTSRQAQIGMRAIGNTGTVKIGETEVNISGVDMFYSLQARTTATGSVYTITNPEGSGIILSITDIKVSDSVDGIFGTLTEEDLTVALTSIGLAADPEPFEPTVNMYWLSNKAISGSYSVLTVTTSADVESLIVDGQILSSRTIRDMKIWVIAIHCGEPGTYSYEVIAVNAEGTESEPFYTPKLTVKRLSFASFFTKKSN